MSNAFAIALEECTAGIRQCDLAKAIAESEAGDGEIRPRRYAANLSRMMRGHQVPRTATIQKIANAIGSLKNLPSGDVQEVRDRLMNAAKEPERLESVAKLEASERRRLYPSCQKALRHNGLSEAEIENVLTQIGVSTMRLIVAAHKRGEEIEVADLRKLSTERIANSEHRETVISVGRAQIIVEGDVSASQMRVLQSAAEMIESVLKL